jgi:hypothetical protein
LTEHTQGYQLQAAPLLDIARETLRPKLRELGLTFRFVEAEEEPEGNHPA